MHVDLPCLGVEVGWFYVIINLLVLACIAVDQSFSASTIRGGTVLAFAMRLRHRILWFLVGGCGQEMRLADPGALLGWDYNTDGVVEWRRG